MVSVKEKIVSRVQALLESDAATAHAFEDPPPEYSRTNPSAPPRLPRIMYIYRSYAFELVVRSDIDAALDAILADDEAGDSDVNAVEAAEVFNIQDGVQVYFITPEGYVSAPSYPR